METEFVSYFETTLHDIYIYIYIYIYLKSFIYDFRVLVLSIVELS